MIPQSSPNVADMNWQSALANAITEPKVLLAQLNLSDKLADIDPALITQFPLRVPQAYVDKMIKGDAADPLLRQVFPLIDEANTVAGFVTDPVGDLLAQSQQGVLQKYHGRALLVTTGACAIHCRYCFRRHFPYADSNPLASQWQETLAGFAADSDLHEVILSGGDPLALSDDRLGKIVMDIATITHIKTLRIHTRLPVVLPQRITPALLAILRQTRLNVVVVIHANHANEIGDEERQVLADLRVAGCTLLNQAVLLRGINNSTAALVNLSHALFDAGVLPYYLHLLDPVAGAAHFNVPDNTAKQLIANIRPQLPGYLVPKLVRETAGKSSKTPVG